METLRLTPSLSSIMDSSRSALVRSVTVGVRDLIDRSKLCLKMVLKVPLNSNQPDGSIEFLLVIIIVSNCLYFGHIEHDKRNTVEFSTWFIGYRAPGCK